MKYLVLIPLLALASCSTRSVVTAPLPVAPPKAVPVAPEVSKIRESIADADKVAVAVRIAAAEASRQITAARVDAERLAKAQTATPADLNGLWKALQSAEERNMFLEAETNRLSIRMAGMGTDAARLQDIASQKDAEASELGRQNVHLGERVTASDKETARAVQSAYKQASRADRLAGQATLHWIGHAIALLLIGGYIAIKFFLPPRLL